MDSLQFVKAVVQFRDVILPVLLNALYLLEAVCVDLVCSLDFGIYTLDAVADQLVMVSNTFFLAELLIGAPTVR